MKKSYWPFRKECPCNVLVKLNILLTTAGMQVLAYWYKRQSSITFSEHDVSLVKLFKPIRQQTGFADKVSIEVSKVPLQEALDMNFREQPFSYTIIGRKIVIKEWEEAKKATTCDGLPIDILGRVVNKTGEPVEGVSITIKGTKKFTITNSDGEFSLAAVDPEAVLVFTSGNMETFE